MTHKNQANIATYLQEQYEVLAAHQVHLRASMELKHQELREMMDLEQSKVLQMINAIKDAIHGKQLQQQPGGKCLRSIDCRCVACIDDCLLESFRSYTIADLNSCTEGIKIEKFEIGMSTSNFVVIESAELFEELSLDVLFMESENMKNTCKVFDTMAERNVADDSFGSGYIRGNFEFEIIKDMYLDGISREPTVSKLDLVVSVPIRELDELVGLDIMPTSCFLTATSYYAYAKQNDAIVTVFDPGGTTLDVLKFSYMKFIDSYLSSLLNVGSGSWLLSCEEFHYICGVVKTLGLPKEIDSANQQENFKGSKEKFPTSGTRKCTVQRWEMSVSLWIQRFICSCWHKKLVKFSPHGEVANYNSRELLCSIKADANNLELQYCSVNTNLWWELPKAINGFTVEDLIVFNCNQSLDKGSMKGGTTVFERLLIDNDVHYMLGSCQILELYKTCDNASHQASGKSCGGVFFMGEKFRKAIQLVLLKATSIMLPARAVGNIHVDNSTAGFLLAGIVITSEAINIEGCGTSSLQVYFHFTFIVSKLGGKVALIGKCSTIKGPTKSSSRGKHLLDDFAAAVIYRRHQRLITVLFTQKQRQKGD